MAHIYNINFWHKLQGSKRHSLFANETNCKKFHILSWQQVDSNKEEVEGPFLAQGGTLKGEFCCCIVVAFVVDKEKGIQCDLNPNVGNTSKVL